MDNFLKSIKSIPGVEGIMVTSYDEEMPNHLFPIKYTPKDIDDLTERLNRLTEFGFDKGLLTINFTYKFIMILIERNLIILLLIDNNADGNFIRKRLTEQLPKLFSSRTPSKAKTAQAPYNLHIEKKLVDGLNELSEKISKLSSRYIASRELKKNRDRLIERYGFLKGLYIDNSGKCAILNHPLVNDSFKLESAFKELIQEFYISCTKINSKVQDIPLNKDLAEMFENCSIAE
ncbi:MAG: hypothetical protein GF315_02965 [candidate division Zixibacteria bacterium]|nr:hypothetical protein [candidate division Zixibacteria bacterium]